MKRLAAVSAILCCALVALAAPAAERKVDKKAMEALANADKLLYRPLEQGLKDIRFTFDVMTKAGKLTCLWMYRAAAGELPAREKWAVTNGTDRTMRKRYAAGLREYQDIARYPILMKSFAAGTEAMDVSWEETPRGGMTVLTAKEQPGKGDGESEEATQEATRITFLWNSDGLPGEMSRIVWINDPDEGRYKEEFSATCDWKAVGKHWVLTLINSDFSGSRILAKYEYKEVKGIIVPSVITRINPMEGEDALPLSDLKINEGIPDEEWSKY